MTEPTELERAVAMAIYAAMKRIPEGGSLIPVARAAIAECFKWRPIETASENDGVVHLWARGWKGWVLGAYNKHIKCWYLTDHEGQSVRDSYFEEECIWLNPSHWMPRLPSPDEP